MKKLVPILLTLICICTLPPKLNAHSPKQSYIFLRVYADGIGGRFEITTEDLNQVMNLNLERGLTVEDLGPYLDDIKRYYLERASFSSAAGAHPIRFEKPSIMSLQDADYIQLNFNLEQLKELPPELRTHYNILFDQDPSHMGIQVVEYNWKAGIHNEEANITAVFGRKSTDAAIDLTGSSVIKGFVAMIRSGMHHIIIGLDHILFLLALLLPAVVIRTNSSTGTGTISHLNAVAFPHFLRPYAEVWTPNESFKTSLIYVIKIVTFFTIAHTITLSLAALELIFLPSALVESIIALSIALAALNNIYPMLKKGKEWLIAFIFGLFHGFGFASVLSEIGLGSDFITLSLLGFNLGVEVGQIIIVLLIFPVLYLFRKSTIYRPVLIYGSVFLILVAMSWFMDRSLGTDLPLDNIVEKIYAKLINVVL